MSSDTPDPLEPRLRRFLVDGRPRPAPAAHPAGPDRRRPELDDSLDADELGRWHWWKDELAEFCRIRGLRVSGTKAELIARIRAHLATPIDARPAAPPARDAHPTVGYLDFSTTWYATHPGATLRDGWKAYRHARPLA